MNQAIRDTLLARVYDVALESPLQLASQLSHRLGCQLYLKREDLQPTHSFKLRGAYNKIVQLSPRQQKRGIIAASAGNHAQGVALSAKRLGLTATIVMPTTTPTIKIEAVKSYGAQVILYGDSYSDAYAHSLEIAKTSKQVFIHPFNDRLVIAGQGTIGREILEQLPDVSHIFVPVGGGGLIAGIAQYIKILKPEVKIIGVEPADSNAMQASLQAGRPVTLDHVGIFADGVAVKQVGSLTFRFCQQFVDEVMTVDTDQICAAIKDIFSETRSIVEPAGALATAGITAYSKQRPWADSKAVAICSGANMPFERLQFVAERTLTGSHKEALYAIELPEQAGALQRFCQKAVGQLGITQFNYRLHSRQTAQIFLGVSLAQSNDKTIFEHRLRGHNYQFIDLSQDDLAKEHLRHMIGGPRHDQKPELIYQINFPERPGALAEFLQSLGQTVNISLFHYHTQGSITARVLIGFENSPAQQLEAIFVKHKIDFMPASSPAVKIFLDN